MGQRRAITGLVAWVVALSTIGVVVVQDATAQETSPKDAQGYVNRGIAYLNKGGNDRAIADFTQAIKLDPKSAQAYCNRGIAYAYKGDKMCCSRRRQPGSSPS